MPRLPRLALIVPFCLLAACVERTPAAGEGPAAAAGRSDGVAAGLPIGATKAEIDARLGMEAGYERNPRNFDEACASYAYGDGPAYVHAVFRGDALVQATDAHPGLCTYGSLVSAEAG